MQFGIDQILIEETGKAGFWGYLDLSAQEGFEITRSMGSSSGGAPIQGAAVWIYWLVELVIVTSFSALGGFVAAKEPFCEDSNEWYGEKERLGNVSLEYGESFLGWLQSNRYAQAGSVIDPGEEIDLPSLEVHLQQAPSSLTSDVILTVSKASLDKEEKLKLEELEQGLISRRDLSQLEQAMQTAQARQAEETDPS